MANDPMDALFQTIRNECNSGVWSRGVELSRAGAVISTRRDDSCMELQVNTRGGMQCPAVTLHLEDEDWECECASPEDPCEHVAAGIIAARQAERSGTPLPGRGESSGFLSYRFERTGRELTLQRHVVFADRDEPLRTTLSAVASDRVDGPRFAASQADLAVEHILGSQRSGTMPREKMGALLAALARCADVRLDGTRVEASADPVLPRGRIEDCEEGFRLLVEPDRSISEIFQNGAVLCGSVLRPVGESVLTRRELEEFSRGRIYSPDDVAELVSQVLPDLRERLEIEIATQRLPTATVVRPRIEVEVTREGDALCVFPTLVYGDPATARIDAGRLVPLAGEVPIRDEVEERRLTRELHNELKLAPGHRQRLTGEEAIATAELLRRSSANIRGDAGEDFYLAPALVPRLHVEADDFDLGFVSESDAEESRTANASSVLRAWREGESLVPLLGGGFAPIPTEWLSRHAERLADLLAAKGDRDALPASALPDLARLCDDLEEPRPANFAQLESLVTGFEGLPHAPLPDGLQAELRAYQKRGVDWLLFLRQAGLGGLLADDMGLGKTLQALCAVAGRTLVVAPTSVLHNWADEAQRFRPDLRVSIYHGPSRALDPEADLTITTYALLRIDADILKAVAWQTVVLDEAQNIKNPDSQAARAAFSLEAPFRLTLTGTPVENRLEELWSQLHFANPGLLGGRSDFQDRYARPIASGDAEAAERLRERIKPFVLRRLKRDVAPELPPRTDIVLRCELDAGERELYDSLRAAMLPDVVRKLREGGNVMAALEVLLRLRQACCHAGLVPGNEDATHSSKLALLLEELETAMADGHRSLVFSQWTSLLDRVEPLLRAADFPFTRLDGSTRDRAGVIQSFQDEDGPPIMLVSLQAGGTGLNLTAADHVFLLDPWWNPAVEQQAADRAHRIGQDRPVVVYRLVAEQTVEERILELQDRKRELAEIAIGGAEVGGQLQREDLLALLE